MVGVVWGNSKSATVLSYSLANVLFLILIQQ